MGDSFVPLPVQEPYPETVSVNSVDSFVPKPDQSMAFSKGEQVQVWSNSKGVWLDAVVTEAFSESCEAEGYTVPKGTLKVSFAHGIKWIMPGQAHSTLRRPPSNT